MLFVGAITIVSISAETTNADGAEIMFADIESQCAAETSVRLQCCVQLHIFIFLAILSLYMGLYMLVYCRMDLTFSKKFSC